MGSFCVIDIGGTNFRCGLYRETTMTRVVSFLTPNFMSCDSVPEIKAKLVQSIVEACRTAAVGCGINGIGISFPGPVTSNGEVLGSSVIFGEALPEPFPLKKLIIDELLRDSLFDEIGVTIVNDVSASAWRYSDRFDDPFCVITVSSGIGSKIFAHNHVLVNDSGVGGEIGHFPANISDIILPCTCGWGKNHIGMISSGRGVEYFARHFASNTSQYRALFLNSELFRTLCDGSVNSIRNEDIAMCADRNDLYSRVVIDYCTRPLAEAICLLLLAMPLKKIIIIGGFASNCRYYLESLRSNVQKIGVYTLSDNDIRGILVMGELDDDHVLIGLGKMISQQRLSAEG